MVCLSGLMVGWLLHLVTGAPLVGGPQQREKRSEGARPENVTGPWMVVLCHWFDCQETDKL